MISQRTLTILALFMIVCKTTQAQLDATFPIKCKTGGDSFTAGLVLNSESEGLLKIKDPPPFDRITNCKLTKIWTSNTGSNKKVIEMKRGICDPERAFEKTDLFPTVMVWLKGGKVELQYRKAGGIEACRIN